ncbi:MAG: protein kinase [Myxococcaceae bacterium]|nr:protein kinase [Myxococcaceae bacterium]
MGDVLLARAEGPEGFARLCAVKRVRGVHAADPEYVKMFIDEARLVAQLAHPAIIQIFELGREAEGYFLAMDYVHGKSLRALQRALLKRGLTLSSELAAYIATRVLAALAYVHDAKSHDGVPLKLIHRDVKPENVLLSFQGDVKLADFGIARSQNASAKTQVGMVRGTVPYITPEQISAGAVTPLIDVWAVGIVLYELLAGERPFKGRGDFETARSILRDTPLPLTSKNPTVPARLALVVDRALQKEPALRYQTAREMAAALEPLLISGAGRPVTDSDIARLMRETFPEETDSPVVEQIGEPLEASDASFEVVTVEPDQVASSVNAPTRSDRPAPSPGRGWAWPRLAAGGVLFGAVATALVLVRSNAAQPARPTPSPVRADAGPQVEPDAGPQAEPDAGAEARARPVSGPGAVDIYAKPWAEVSLKGKTLGPTPLFDVALPAGEHTLVFNNPELKLVRKVKVRVDSGKKRRVTVDLEDGR